MAGIENYEEENIKIERLPILLLIELLNKRAEDLRNIKNSIKKRYSPETEKEIEIDKIRRPLQLSQLKEKEYGLLTQFEEIKKDYMMTNLNTRLNVEKVKIEINELNEKLNTTKMELEAAKKRFEKIAKNKTNSSIAEISLPLEEKAKISYRKRTLTSSRPFQCEKNTKRPTTAVIPVNPKVELRKMLDDLVYENNL